MASSGIQPEIYAVIGAALLGALIGQFLSFYRKRVQQIEEMKSILELISILDEDEIPIKIDRPESFLWFLRDELFQSYKANILYLEDAGVHILSLIRNFPDPGEETPSRNLDEEQLKREAQHAKQALGNISPIQVIYLSIIGFLGLSQEKHGDRLEDMLVERETGELVNEVQSNPELPRVGVLIPQSRILKGIAVWVACMLLLITGAVGIFLSGTFTEQVETAIMGALTVLVILSAGIIWLIQLLSIPVRSDD